MARKGKPASSSVYQPVTVQVSRAVPGTTRRESHSITVYDTTLETVAQRVEAELRRYHRTTSLSDGRHKRR